LGGSGRYDFAEYSNYIMAETVTNWPMYCYCMMPFVCANKCEGYITTEWRQNNQ